MIEDLKKIIAVLKYWNYNGLNPPQSYQDRFLLQKITFICKALGIDIPGYDFNLYLNGPYSPALTKDYYQHVNLVIKLDTDYSLNNKETLILDLIQSAIFQNYRMERHSGEFLEAVSTILYFKTVRNLSDDDDVFSETRRIKPHLSDSIITIGIDIAKTLLFKPEYLTVALKKEMELWDKSDN